MGRMTFSQARQLCDAGVKRRGKVIFFSMDGFSSDESIHFYQGKSYFEDGVKPDDYWLDKFGGEDNKTFYVVSENVDMVKLKELHDQQNRTGILITANGKSFNECIIRK